MIDNKVYKTDFQSEFSEFFKTVSDETKAESEAVISEVNTYSKVNQLRDNVDTSAHRFRIWEGF